jgi:hypothetical protein
MNIAIKNKAFNDVWSHISKLVAQCYHSNRQPIQKGESFEIIGKEVTGVVMNFKPSATLSDITTAFLRGAAGDYEDGGQPPYLSPNKFRYFLKKYYEQKMTINAQQEEDARHALPYFTSWEERQIYHITRRYADTLRGWAVQMSDADIIFSFLKKIGIATDADYSNDDIVARAKYDISLQPAADTPLSGLAKSVLARMDDYNEVAKVAKGIFIKSLMSNWRKQGMTPQDVQDMLRSNL